MDSTPRRVILPACLADVKIESLPSSAFYIADFITEEEEQLLVKKIESAPKPRWKQLSKRRVQVWPSDLTKKNILLETPLPAWLKEPIITRLLSCPVSMDNENIHMFSHSPHCEPNHVLINEYLPGQGIMPHKDGSAYHPVVSTVSLGASVCLELYGTKEDGSRENEPRWKIIQESRSLLITTGELYTDFLHGIAETQVDTNLNSHNVSNWALLRSPDQVKDGKNERQTRTSLTYRDVIRVSKLGSKLGMSATR